MSNKIALATIQFRADAKGANVALDSLRASAAEARKTVNEMQDALDHGIKKLKDANGVEFNVADRLKSATKEARGFEAAIRELMKGATALESVVKNITLGEIEKSSRAELKGAINAAESRKRSVRGDDEESLKMQRELNIVIEESRKQLNNLDRDTQKVIETLKNGGVVAEATLEKEQKGLKEILSLIPKGTDEYKQYAAQLKEIQTYVASIRQQEQAQATALLSDKNLGKYSEEQIRAAIQSARELIQTYKTASPEAKALADNIVRAEQHLKEYGIEAARAAAKETAQIKTQEEAEKQLQITMNKRLRSLSSISADALAESHRYWEAQKNGAERGTDAFNKAAAALKKIEGQERSRKVTSFGEILGDPGKYGVAEVRNAVQEMEKLRDSVTKGIPIWHQYNKMVEQGRAYLDNLSKNEAMDRVSTQMQSLNTLSASGLAEVKKYWEAMVAGADKGSTELATYKAELDKVVAEEGERAKLQAKSKVGILGNDNLGQYSEAQIREAIEAGKQLIQTYKTADPAAKVLAKDIVAAEEHLKQYGIEAERTAQRESQTVKLMADQFNKLRDTMSDAALKANERYWQQLIDDPKNANKNLETYRKNLKTVQEEIQRRADKKIQTEGESALSFFRGDTSNASANDIRQQAEALKKYRDSLPQKDQALVIQEIDSYLAKTGKTATTSTEEVMELSKALGLSANAGKTARGMTKDDADYVESLKKEKRLLEDIITNLDKGSDAYKAYKSDINAVNDELKKFSFSGSADELQKAQKSIEQAMATTDKGTPKYERLRMALARVKAEMAGAGISAQKTQEVLKNPTAVKSVDTLKNAVSRARAEIDVMAQRSDRLRRLIEEAGSNENTKHRLKGLEQALKANDSALKELTEDTKRADFAQKQLANTAKGSATAFEKAWSRLKTYITLYVGAAAAMQKLTATFGDMMELSDKMGEVQKTTNLSSEAVGRLSVNLAKLDVRTPLTQLMEISAAAGQLGLKTEEDIQGFTEAANKLMIALPEMGKEAATEMMRVAIATGEVDKIRKEMQEGLIDGSSATAVAMEKIASTIDRLRANSASTAPEITDFVKRVGAVGAQSGISIDQVSALGSTISSLGLRIEMSATALSRMIPAIRRNAFELSQAIGVSPEAVRSLFDAGRGMEAVLMILQRMKDQGMDADSIEKMLGMGGMQEIMKDLNQQGARAGIVFAGLSQNVDELRRQLGLASQAYEENTAIQMEFDRMNETTAAKWERLKNQIEEAFVSDTMQSWLGSAIDGVRWLVDLLVGRSGLSAALFSILTLVGLLKVNAGAALWGMLAAGFTKITALCKDFDGSLDKVIVKMKAMTAAQWTNWIIAVVAALGMLIYKLKEMSERAATVANEMAKLDAEVLQQTKTVDGLFRTVAKTNAELGNAKSRLEEVRKANEDTTDAENKLKKASADHAAAIRDINSKYGQYLGYMLSETSSALQLAKARELINAKLRETITLKQREAALGNVEQEYGGDVNKKASSVEQTLQTFFGKDYNRAAKVSVAISEAAQKYANDSKKYQLAVKKILKDNKIQEDVAESYMDTFEGYRKSIEEYNKQEDIVMNRFEARANVARKDSREKAVAALNAIMGDWKQLLAEYRKAEGDEKEKLAVEVYKQQRAYANAVANNANYFEGDARKAVFDRQIENMKTYEKGLRNVAGEAIRTVDAMERAESKITGQDFSNGGESDKNPWGSALPSDSTAYKDMTATALVNRRKQMKDFVNAIQTDSDVQSVLGEDAALKKAIENGMSSDMRTVIEWYNTERLKIQDELHARHLTNTGDWMDPKKQKARRKRLQDEMKAYLEELDAYYTERKTHIQEAGNEEGLTEAEVRNRTLANEMEWRQRRAELQIMYSAKAKQVTQDEQDAIHSIIAERTGDDVKFIKATIDKTVEFSKAIRDANAQGAKEYRKFQGDLDLGSQKDYNKQQMALHQHLKAIQDIIDKERPFNGITKNLRENLVTMDILTADMRDEYNELMKAGKDMTDFNRRQAEEEVRRTTFLLGEAEHAYSTTVEQVMSNMAAKGMTAWAEQLKQSPEMREGMMAQLRSTYDAIQEAIKKEASLMKKQAEIMWNNILMPGGDGKTTVKDAFEQAIAQLGIEQGRVSRANSMIGAGATSDRVADKLAIKQMQLQLTMQTHYYNLMQKQGKQRIDDLKRQADELERQGKIEEASRVRQDKEHAEMSLRLATTKEQTEELKLQEEIIAKTEESQARLYQQLKEWGDLIASSVQGVFEAESAGNREYYNELAKMNLTGKGGPGAGTYIVIENEGTDEAKAHYEWLDQREALERQHQIELQNARADAWKKVMDDINMKMSDMITDQINAMLQNEAVDANTSALYDNTAALYALAAALGVGAGEDFARNEEGFAVDAEGKILSPVAPAEPAEKQEQNAGLPGWGWPTTEEEKEKMKEWDQELLDSHAEYSITKMQEVGDAVQDLPSAVTSPFATSEVELEKKKELIKADVEAQKEGQKEVTQSVVDNSKQQQTTTTQANKKIENSGNSLYAHLTSACNLYGAAYQAMSNDNLSATQKFEMIGLQAAGNAAIAALTAANTENNSKTVSLFPLIFGKCVEINPIAGAAIFAALTAVIGGLMGMAASKVAKGKAEIQKVTGASASAGRLATGMMTYAEGNVNELTDPDSLTPGRSYNVDGADGRTYRAKYTGRNARTHITSGPEFHLVGEKGQEAIIDAHTTRNIRLNEPQIWQDIQTLYNGGRLSAARRRTGRGVRTFAEGNLDDFEEVDSVLDDGTESGLGTEQMQQLQASLDRNSDVLERAVTEGIHARFDVYGKGGLIDSYDTGKKNVTSHGERY